MCHSNGFPPAVSKYVCSSCRTSHVLMPCGDMPAISILIPRRAERKCRFWDRLCKPQTCRCMFEKVLTELKERPHLCHPILVQKCLLALPPSGSHRMTQGEPGTLRFLALCPAKAPTTSFHLPSQFQPLRIIKKSDGESALRSNSGGKYCLPPGAGKGL